MMSRYREKSTCLGDLFDTPNCIKALEEDFAREEQEMELT